MHSNQVVEVWSMPSSGGYAKDGVGKDETGCRIRCGTEDAMVPWSRLLLSQNLVFPTTITSPENMWIDQILYLTCCYDISKSHH